MTLLRSSAAVLTGYVAAVVLLAGTYYVGLAALPLEVPAPGAKTAPSTRVLALASVLCFGYGVIASSLTVMIARRRASRHALWLAGMTLLLGLAKPLLAPESEPLRSHLVLLLPSVGGVLVGGQWWSWRKHRADSHAA